MQHAKAVILGVELALLMTLSRFGPDQNRVDQRCRSRWI